VLERPRGLNDILMKKDGMLAEYDLAGRKGVRGKYVRALKNGYSVRVLRGQNVVSDRLYAAIEQDVQEYFPDSKAVNIALRKLISLVPSKDNR